MKKTLAAILLLGILLSACQMQRPEIPSMETTSSQMGMDKETMPAESTWITEETSPVATLPPIVEEAAEPTRPNPQENVSEETEPLATENEMIHEHKYDVEIVPATCLEAGFTFHVCSCGNSYVDNEVPALGHKWSEWTVIQEATSVSEGTESRKCYECGAEENRSIPKLPPIALDYQAAMTYGNQYAQSAYGALQGDYLNFENAGYYPFAQLSMDIIQNNGGQPYLNYQVELKVDSTFESLQSSGGSEGAAAFCDVHEAKYDHEQPGYVYIYIYYG